MPTLLCCLLLAAGSAVAAKPSCRCTPPDPCWSKVPWDMLNKSVGGRLEVSRDEMQPCIRDLHSTACTAALSGSDDEFWLSAQPNGYIRSGLFNAWNITSISSYSVRAETENDFQEAIGFAHKHNLRLVVKGTGHDWLGRSLAPGSLLLWTHLRKDIGWDDAYVPDGCSMAPVPAVTVQSGVQFRDLYPMAMARGKVIMGGTCDSVGVGGCFLGGCYGPFSKKFGNGASNMLQARVVLANGTLVTANKCSHPDLFWALRGGGGGVAGAVTEFTVRSHRAPKFIQSGSFSGKAKTVVEYKVLLKEVLRIAEVAMGHVDIAGDGGLGFGGSDGDYGASISVSGYEADKNKTEALLQPLVDFVKAQGGGIEGSTQFSSWHESEYDPSKPSLPWMEKHPEREISTAMLASLSRYLPRRALQTDAGRDAVAQGLVDTTLQLPTSVPQSAGFMLAKAQGGISREMELLFNETSQNPVLLDAVGLTLMYTNIPSLPQLPPSSRLLQALWPRLQHYAITSKSDPLWAPCSSGADGNETAAVECMTGWSDRVPGLQAELDEVRKTLWRTFPNLDASGMPFSGSYYNEADYYDYDFQRSHWGTNYDKLLQVKAMYDPSGLFICHHCVGSEFWTPDGNCRLHNATA